MGMIILTTQRRLCLSLLLHRISFFLFFPSQQKACAHAKPAGVPPIFELADRTIFTRDKCTRVAQNSPQRRIIIGVITAVFHRYSFSSVFIRSGYHPLSLSLLHHSKRITKIHPFFEYISYPADRLCFFFLPSPSLGEGATNAGIFASSQVEIDIRNNSACPREF